MTAVTTLRAVWWSPADGSAGRPAGDVPPLPGPIMRARVAQDR
jgi:hypothetical protein